MAADIRKRGKCHLTDEAGPQFRKTARPAGREGNPKHRCFAHLRNFEYGLLLKAMLWGLPFDPWILCITRLCSAMSGQLDLVRGTKLGQSPPHEGRNFPGRTGHRQPVSQLAVHSRKTRLNCKPRHEYHHKECLSIRLTNQAADPAFALAVSPSI